jgi:hypothetical protein
MKNKIIDTTVTLTIMLFCFLLEFWLLIGLETEAVRQSKAVTDHSVSSIAKILDANKVTLNSYDARISRLEKMHEPIMQDVYVVGDDPTTLTIRTIDIRTGEFSIPDVRPCKVTTCTLRIDKEE